MPPSRNPEPGIKRRLAALIGSIERSPSLFSIAGIKKLRGRHRYYRLRVGEYRLGLEIQNTTVVFIRFLHRRDIYRYFP